MKEKIIIAGGTGFLGQSILQALQHPKTELVVLSRTRHPDAGNVRYVRWDAQHKGDWQAELEGSTALINLAGKSVNCRYTARNKRDIIASRVDSTLLLGQAISECRQPPKVWINAGSVAIFGDGGSDLKTETSAPGDGFPAEVCRHWEAAFGQIDTPQTRRVLCRISLVLQRKRGLLWPFVNLVRLGLGGTIGTGQQYISWIHEDDFTALVREAIDHEDFEGVYHAASPQPVTNRKFLSELRTALRIPFGIPTPGYVAKLGAFIAGTEPQLLLLGRRVVSERLAERQFAFRYPDLTAALAQLLNAPKSEQFMTENQTKKSVPLR